MFVYDYQVFSWKYLKSSQKSSAASYTPKTFYALSHPFHGRGMKKNVNAKCGYVMQKYYFCSRKAAPDRIGVYISLKRKKRKGARVAEEARLESVYTSKAYRGFESPSLRCNTQRPAKD